MTLEEFQREIEEALELNSGEVSPDTMLEQIPTFDSLGRLAVLAMIDTVFSFPIDAEYLDCCGTVKDLYSFLIEQAKMGVCEAENGALKS